MTHTIDSLNCWLGYLFPLEIVELTRLILLLPNHAHVLEIGAGGGVSAAVILAARPDLYLLTVDVQAEDSPFGGLYSQRVALESCGLWNPARHKQINADSQFMCWYDDPFDFIFIDGGHEYEEACADILNWLPHVKPGGLLAVHDYDKGRLPYGFKPGHPHPLVLEGVDRAVFDLLLGHYPLVSQVDSLITFRIYDFQNADLSLLSKEGITEDDIKRTKELFGERSET